MPMTLDDFHRETAAMVRDLDTLIRHHPEDPATLAMWRGLRDRLVFALRLVNQVAGDTAQLELLPQNDTGPSSPLL